MAIKLTEGLNRPKQNKSKDKRVVTVGCIEFYQFQGFIVTVADLHTNKKRITIFNRQQSDRGQTFHLCDSLKTLDLLGRFPQLQVAMMINMVLTFTSTSEVCCQLMKACPSQVNLNEEKNAEEEFLNSNVIRKTREIIKRMNQKQKFEKAKAHIMDSLTFKQPRFESQSLEIPLVFTVVYGIQSSRAWEWLLFILGYVFMYMVILDSESYYVKIGIEASILSIFLADCLFLLYCKTYDHVSKKSRYSTFFIFKIIVILLLTIDLIIFIILPCYNSRPIRPFRILRAFIPVMFDSQLRKSLYSLLSAYKDILVNILFYTFIICGWALIGCKVLTFDPTFIDPNYPQAMDPYKNDYSSLGSMIFVTYVCATYDSFPDNQVLAIQNYKANYIYFVVFVFLNMFLFSNIIGSIVYLKFRQTRSKIILVDQIRQQHSLLLAFVTLAEDQQNLSIEKLIKFLLFLYKFKIRYIEHITDICLRLDDNNNRSIQVNEFMQLSKILLQNSAMLPPIFNDIQLWIDFRNFVNSSLKLKAIVTHWIFELCVSIIIIASFIDAIFSMFSNNQIAATFNSVFVYIFIVQIIKRIVAIGPENFFRDRWNSLDTTLVIFGTTFYYLSQNLSVNPIARMSRIFRIATLLRLISHSNFMKNVKLQILDKIKNIFSIILQIFPIIFKFFPMFLFFFFIYSIFGMEVFYNSYSTSGNPAYNNYIQYATFETFLQAHYIMVQVLTEAGWSQVAFDHAWRNAQYFSYAMLFFMFMHLSIVYIIATLIKGIFWEIFFTVDKIFQERKHDTAQQESREEQIIQKTEEFKEISDLMNKNESITPNTIIKRNLVESKLDIEIFKQLKFTYDKQARIPYKPKFHIRSKRSLMVQKMIDDWKINIKDLDVSEDVRSRYSDKNKSHTSSDQPSVQLSQSMEKKRIALNQIEEVDEEDFESEIEDLLNGLIISPKILYNQIVAYPKIFVDFLNSKFVKPETLIDRHQFDLNLHPLYNQQSMYYHIYEIHALLNIETSKRQQKAMIIRGLQEENVITEDTVEKLIKKKLQDKVFKIDTNGTLRRLFLSQTNEDLIKKFEVEYFSDLYGNSFKQINKLTLEPLMHFTATLVYSLRNILRYPQIGNTQFFEMFTHIEDQISNKLLKRGSLFKFVYKIDHQSDIWFSIEYKKLQELRVHFIKTGLWAYTKEMTEQQVYYARDVFNWNLEHRPDRKICEQYIKRFYQSFQGLAFSLLDQNEFFRSNPVDYIYDLYIQHFDVQKMARFKSKKLQISKIMVVILSKEEEREDIGATPLNYPISDIIVTDQRRQKKTMDFTFDESDNQTYEKLKNIAAMDVQKIVESEGLPFSYIVNLLEEITDIIKINSQNFIYQIQQVLNDQYETINDSQKHEDNIIGLTI